ncbi:geranylgeranyl pyrophosphate synthetase [Alcanivorax hongdengensis A-11-3]|uniref:Geranylgeranyl pyrophosphate synthetase n=1 Tax=Alcanivorax hongdengensis A-11-3 TaxID=1177179 RepID=L0WID1_9GAMM|nr:farnesyl diphosphate synthase [Alcanivorax hongdengensis]EKF75892.1 geranylgeranyl pyrophosphate synthetase [Alcanivorax hongdengensis A-11-3]
MSSSFPALDRLGDDARVRLEQTLDQHLPLDSAAPRLSDAMRYAALSGGKRIRPLLVYGAARLAGATLGQADIPAAAVEMVHAYSLVHDDLPAMDDDDLRRGQPTCHRAFDEATAILAGDTLHTRAFELLASAGDYPPATRITMVQRLCEAAGVNGMAAGQMQDMLAHGRVQTLAALEAMHYLKTGRLITASLQLGYLAAQVDQPTLLQDLCTYGDAIGLAFQIQDDILDITAGTEQLGKPAGSDEKHQKSTFPSLLGLEPSRQRASQLCETAQQALAGYGDSALPLQQLAQYIISRNH